MWIWMYICACKDVSVYIDMANVGDGRKDLEDHEPHHSSMMIPQVELFGNTFCFRGAPACA